MAEYFVGPVLEKFIDASLEYLKDQVGWKTGVEEELKKLQFILPQIQAVVSAYSQVETKDPALNEWYWQLRDSIDEADDVLDEFEYWKLEKKKQVIGENKGKRKAEVPVWNIYENVKRALRIGKRAPKSDPNLTKLEVAVHKLHEISAQVSTFHSLVKDEEEKQQKQQRELQVTRETGSLIKNVPVGRSNEMEFIWQWLIRNSCEIKSIDINDLYKNISLLSVVGLGGMGKTTLLQDVYNKDATNLFDAKMWVCVSINFNAKTLIKKMLESLKNKKPEEDTLESLQKSLQSEVKSKRFLLVLDDIWEEDDAKWENVLAPLQNGSFGSKIVITTRLELVATKFANLIKKRTETLPLKALKEEECLELFNSHAFAGVENPDDEFKSIASKMVKKLFGSPLAAKVIGGILNSYIDKSYWKKVLNTNIGKVGHDQNQLLPILKLSYIYLPNFLQNCFSFCSIFPQDHEFEKDDLVRMWISLGFINSSNIQEETFEEGRRYFNILVQKSFFDEFHRNDGIIYYKMHDLLHELAQYVAAHECLTIVGDKAFTIPPTTRHLSIYGIGSLAHGIKSKGEFKNLRSLFLFLSSSDDAEFIENVICEILKASKSIRLLAINLNNIRHIYELSEEIGCLIHLRYLKVERLYDFELPRSISHLYHLQFIISKRLPSLQSDWIELMPNENCQIILNYLAINDPSATKLTMEPLRRISSFRQLVIESNDELVSFPIETEQWFLLHISSLIWLIFANLQSLESLPSSLECLSSLNYLYVENVPQLKLLPNPPASLVTLHLVRLKSLQCLPSSLPNISSLKCYGLENLDRLPSSLSTCLRELYIIKVPRLLELPDLPSSIERLELEKLESLKCLPSSLPTFSSLTFLKLINIPLLELLPDLPSSLKHLEFEDLESLQCLPSSLSNITSLTSLRFKNIPPFKSLSDLPSSLITLNLEDLKSLQCHQPYSLLTFSSLTNLTFKNIPLLKSLPDLPSSLKDLTLEDLELQCLPSSLSTNSSLTNLNLTKILLLKSLPDLPSSLKGLRLADLELQCLPYSLSTISSLTNLTFRNIPFLKSLPDPPSSLKDLRLEDLQSLPELPSSLSTISSLTNLNLINIPLLKSLTDLPSSLKTLYLQDLESLECLPASLSTISSLTNLSLTKIPLLKSLPDLPSSLKILYLLDLESLKCLSSSLSTFSSLKILNLIKLPLLYSLPDLPSSLRSLWICEVPVLLELPDLPASLKQLDITDCEPLLMERYPNF